MNNYPSALLLGDSISLDYRNFVREMLKDVMNIYYPPENGRFAAYTFRALYEWSRDGQWSSNMNFVYWNNGLWDVVRIFGDEPQTPLPEYEATIRRIYERLKYLFPKALIIFATTTPVVEELFDKKLFYRSNADIELYNEAATRIILKCGGAVHNLYGKEILHSHEAHRDSTHFIPFVSQVIAKNICELFLRLMKK